MSFVTKLSKSNFCFSARAVCDKKEKNVEKNREQFSLHARTFRTSESAALVSQRRPPAHTHPLAGCWRLVK